jgi:restriction system protein
VRAASGTSPPQDEGDPDDSDAEASAEGGWKEQLLEALMGMEPGAFERLARRLLREADSTA